MHGMRERAKLIGGKLTVWSGLDSGTDGRAEHSRRARLHVAVIFDVAVEARRKLQRQRTTSDS